MLWLALVLGSFGNNGTPKTETVDLLEVNHKYGDDGKHVYDQLIVWERLPDGKYHVRHWRLLDDRETCPGRPLYCAQTQDYRATWKDEAGLRAVRSKAFRETWSHSDPEREDLKVWPQIMRQNLLNPKLKEPKDGETRL